MNTLTNRAWTGLLFAGLMSIGCSGTNSFTKSNHALPTLPTKNSVASNQNQTPPSTTKSGQQLPANPAGLPNMPGAQLTSTPNQMPSVGSTLSIPGTPPSVQPVNYNAPVTNPSPYGNAVSNSGTRATDSATRNSMPMPSPALPPMPSVPNLPQPVPPSMEVPSAPAPIPAMGMPPPAGAPQVSALPTPVSQPAPVIAPPPPPSTLPALRARPVE